MPLVNVPKSTTNVWLAWTSMPANCPSAVWSRTVGAAGAGDAPWAGVSACWAAHGMPIVMMTKARINIRGRASSSRLRIGIPFELDSGNKAV